MPKTYSVTIEPMRHDDPRKATRDSRIKARQDAEGEIRKNNLPVDFRTNDYDKAKEVAHDMEAALKSVDRNAVISEVMSVPFPG